MTIGEVILHCEGRAKADCSECAEEYRQLAEWLSKLQKYEDTGLTPEEILDGKMLTGWIPVEEKLPEYDGLYLVCLDDGYISSVEYVTGRSGEQDWELWADSGEIMAWMPLPEPYRPAALREAGQDAAAQILQPAT